MSRRTPRRRWAWGAVRPVARPTYQQFSLVGKYEVEKWGVCTISKNEDDFSIVGGDENFEFAVIYPTSKPNFFIIKYVAYKQPKLVELDTKGNLKIDDEGTIKIYKRIH